jgi:hypothetical protein
MGKFTVSNDKNIEEKIQGDLDIICDEILKKTIPVSIILTGSFGRGEGSVIVFNTRTIPLNDYDILLLMEEKIPEHVLKNIEGRIYDRLHYSRPETRKIVFSDFTISLFQTTLDDIKSYANVGSYEIKTRSRLLYGKDFRNKIPLTINDIPVATGFHFLFNKLIHLLGNFSSAYLENPPQGKEKIFLVYTCGKAYIEMGTALSILAGDYRPGYSDRNEFLRTGFAGLFPELVKKSPELYRKIDYFTQLKLSPDPDRYSALDPVALWFETRQDLLSVIDYYLQASKGKKSGTDRISLSDDLYHSTKKNYFHGQFKYFIRVKYGINSDLLATLLNRLYQRYTSIEFYSQSKDQERNTVSVLLESPILKIFSLATVLLDSLNQTGEIDCRLLDHFNKEFRKIVCDRTVSGQENDWDLARLNLLSASEIYRRLR